MRTIGLIVLVSIISISCSDIEKGLTKQQLTEEVKAELITQFRKMENQDQLNRSFLQVGTLNQSLIDSVSKLSMESFSFILNELRFKRLNKL